MGKKLLYNLGIMKQISISLSDVLNEYYITNIPLQVPYPSDN